MASNYNRKSASSGSRRQPARTRGAQARSAGPRRPAAGARPAAPYRAIPGGRLPRTGQDAPRAQYTSVRVGDIDRAARASQARGAYQRYLVVAGVVVGIVAALAVAFVIASHSSLFTITSVSVKGVEHLTAQEMQLLAGVDEGTTLLNVDTGTIKSNLLADAWVADVQVNRVFPDTLEIVVTERTITAVVEVPIANSQDVQPWAIASDGMWLMPIPDEDSEQGRLTNPKVYEDAAAVLHITDVPYGTSPEIGTYCTDANVNNALAVVAGMTTELADRVSSVKATETESTTLTISDGPDIVFGTAEDIREKERVCLEIMEQHPDGVSYINVRTPSRPTWRAL